jgi:zinc/manganese transport system substrate-binding protein
MMISRIGMTLLLLLPLPALAALNVFACEPEWAALVQELGGELVTVTSATTGLQDPHHIQARPSLIAQMRKAGLVVCTGAELETGWLPLLLRRAGNPAVQPGKPGYFEAASAVALLDKPEKLDRAAGDVHAQGNPHIQTNPHNIARVAKQLAARLATIDAAHAGQYAQRHSDFQARWSAAILRWEQQAAGLRDMRVVVQHAAWVYFNAWLGLQQVATIEPAPGVPPSSADLQALLARLKLQPAALILHSAYQDDRSAQWLGERTAIPVATLPFTVGGNAEATDLFRLFDVTLQAMLEAKP